jgi:hypothetical protein
MIELWAVKAFFLTPVIACLFFVAGVLFMLEMQVSQCNECNEYDELYKVYAENTSLVAFSLW